MNCIVLQITAISKKNKIVRETKTTFVLDNDERIRKGNRRLIGHEYSSLFYSEKSDYGKVLKQKYERFTIEKKNKNHSS